jgi:hypothetical protein
VFCTIAPGRGAGVPSCITRASWRTALPSSVTRPAWRGQGRQAVVLGRIARQPAARDEDHLFGIRYFKRHQQNESGAALLRPVVEEQRPVGDEFARHNDAVEFQARRDRRAAVQHSGGWAMPCVSLACSAVFSAARRHLPVAERDAEQHEDEGGDERNWS